MSDLLSRVLKKKEFGKPEALAFLKFSNCPVDQNHLGQGLKILVAFQSYFNMGS